MEKNESIIGKEYRAIDNSYAVNITHKECYSGLAGAFGVPFEISTIITNPFMCNVLSKNGNIVVREMIIVEDRHNQFHSVMYFEHGVITKSVTNPEID